MPTSDDRLTLLERLAAQQSDVGDILVELVRRLEHDQFLHDTASTRHSAVLHSLATLLTTLTHLEVRQQTMLEALTGIAAQHDHRMDRLQQTLDHVTNLLPRQGGHLGGMG